MSRTLQRRSLCKGERSRVRNGPAFFIERRRSCVPSQAGLVCWFGKWPCKLERLSYAARSEGARKPVCAKKVESGMARLCFSRLGLLYPGCQRDKKMKEYKTINGTSFDVRTPDEIVAILENARQNRTRLHVSLGETEGPEAGNDWLEENMVYGVIGRSTGSIKIPLLIHNRKSSGGPGLLDHCIVRIRTSAGGRVLWQHPGYHHGDLEIQQRSEPVTTPDGRILAVTVIRDGQEHAAFESVEQARRWAVKLGVVAPIAG